MIAQSTGMKVKAVLIAILLMVVLPVNGCIGMPPQYQVDSYEALKGEFVAYPHVLFADLTPLSGIDLEYWVYYTSAWSFGCSSPRQLTDYHIYNMDNTERSDAADGVLDEISIRVTDHDYMLNRKEAEYDPPTINMTYRGVEMEGSDEEFTDASFFEDSHLPDGTFAYGYFYWFVFEGCDYSFDGRIVLLPDEAATADTDALVDRGQQEVYTLIDSILDQGNAEKAEN